MPDWNNTGFYDLNVHESCLEPAVRVVTLQTLYNLGYRTIAVNQVVEVDAHPETKKKKKKGEPRDVWADVLPEPCNLQELRKLAVDLNVKNVTFLNRLTLIFASQDSLHRYLKSSNFKKYDIIAVIPTTTPALMFTCSNLDADIIGFNPQNKLTLRMNRKIYTQLVDKGYHFELTYSSAIQDSTKRKNLIHLSHLYHTFGKSKNIIFSSAAESHMFIRSPYDVTSLGLLFGLNELQSKNAILHNPKNVILNAIGRQHGKAVMMVENTEPMDLDEPIVLDSDEDPDEPAQKKSKL
uniref:Uncharacterized protein n=1 Tax=Dendroctonus ponderosae TaxID=77166 RepID=J3JUJ7_DENPD|nr:unknown [Dendroctonus ponderosae]